MATETHADAPSHDGRVVQILLQSGLAISALLMVAGLALQLLSGSHQAASVKMFELASGTMSLGTRLMGLGILALALTPALRVVMLIVLWVRERDWRFVAVACAVVVVLALAVAAGGG